MQQDSGSLGLTEYLILLIEGEVALIHRRLSPPKPDLYVEDTSAKRIIALSVKYGHNAPVHEGEPCTDQGKRQPRIDRASYLEK